VARAIAGSRIPIISAVGHEIDFTIADFVADLRAPTPSAAAELAIPDRQELERRITQCSVRLIRSLENRARRMRREVDREIRTLIGRPRAMIEERAQLVDELVARSVRAVRSLVRYRRESFRAALNRLEPLSPLRILARGYSLTTTEDDCPVTDASMVKKGSRIIVQFGKGQALCRVLAKGDNLKTPRGIQNKLPGIDSKATRLSVNGASTTGENPNE